MAKNKYVVLFSLLLFLRTFEPGVAQPAWEPVVADFPGNVTEVVAGPDGEPVVVSDNVLQVKDGSGWTVPTDVITFGSVTHRLQRSGSGMLYVCGAGRTQRSSDGGRTWSPAADVNVDYTTASLDALYSLLHDTLRRSTDDGITWQTKPHPFGSGSFNALTSPYSSTIFAQQGNTFHGPGYDSRWGVSTDGGETWSRFDAQFDGWYVDRVFPGPSVHFLTAFNRSREVAELYRSVDNGTTWQLVADRPDRIDALAVLSSSVLLHIGDGRAFRSVDGGLTWSELALSHCPGHDVMFTAIALSRTGQVFLGTEANGLRVSDDEGMTWSDQELATAKLPNLISMRGELYASLRAGYSRRGWKSVDGGDTWECLAGTPDVIDSGGTWYRLMNGLGSSADQGTSWTGIRLKGWTGSYSAYDAIALPDGSLLMSCAIDVLSGTSGVWRKDAGSMEAKLVLPLTGLRFGSLHRSATGVIYYHPDSEPHAPVPLYRSIDNGRTWTAVDPTPAFHRMTVGGDGTLYGIENIHLFRNGIRSTDMGTTWEPLALTADTLVDLMAFGEHEVVAIAASRTEGRGVVYSSDRGGTFLRADTGLNNTWPVSFACESNGTVFLRTDRTLYRSVAVADVPEPPLDPPVLLNVWPVPTDDELTLRIDDADVDGMPANIRLVAADGKTALTLNTLSQSDDPLRLDVRSLPGGYYRMIVQIDGRTLTRDVVIVR